MAQWVKKPADKPEDPGSIPGTHMVGRREQTLASRSLNFTLCLGTGIILP